MLSPIRHLTDRLQGKAPKGAKRASGWARFRREHLGTSCEACGRSWSLEAHHIVPFHLAPDLELEPDNLLTLCRRCHLLIGHLAAWARFNPFARSAAATMLEAIAAAR